MAHISVVQMTIPARGRFLTARHKLRFDPPPQISVQIAWMNMIPRSHASSREGWLWMGLVVVARCDRGECLFILVGVDAYGKDTCWVLRAQTVLMQDDGDIGTFRGSLVGILILLAKQYKEQTRWFMPPQKNNPTGAV